jgi:hypothetical protein
MGLTRNEVTTPLWTPPFGLLPSSGRLLHVDRHQALVTWDHLALVIWRGVCDTAAAQRVERAGMDVLRRYPRGGALMGVVEESAIPPSPDMRKLSTAVNDRLSRQGLVGVAGVLTQTGFAGSVVRGVITGMTLLSRSDCPFKVFENHTDAATWLSQNLITHGERMGAAECAQVVGSFRSRYADHWQRHWSTPAA